MTDRLDSQSRHKYGGTRYNSRWDAFTWLILALCFVCLVWPLFFETDVFAIIIIALSFVFILLVFLGIYYKIDGDKLVIYQFFRPTAFPIDKIEEIKPTTSALSAPAASLTGRIAIKFSDRKVLKSSAPMIISPVRQKEFIAQLLAVNPNIKCS